MTDTAVRLTYKEFKDGLYNGVMGTGVAQVYEKMEEILNTTDGRIGDMTVTRKVETEELESGIGKKIVKDSAITLVFSLTYHSDKSVAWVAGKMQAIKSMLATHGVNLLGAGVTPKDWRESKRYASIKNLGTSNIATTSHSSSYVITISLIEGELIEVEEKVVRAELPTPPPASWGAGSLRASWDTSYWPGEG